MDHSQHGDLARGLVESYSVNERMNQMVLEHLDPAAWRAALSGSTGIKGSKGRTIAAIFAHVHHVRRKWVRLSAPHLQLPALVDRSTYTIEGARAALAESGARCTEMIAESLRPSPSKLQGEPQNSVESFRRDGWAKPWTPGAAMVAYMITHDAHHRGQVLMLAHQLGYPLGAEAAQGMWVWERLWRECGFPHPR